MNVVPQQLFSSAAVPYARFRSGYPRREVAVLAHRLGLDRTQTIVDVGAGSGQLTLPMAEHVRRVIAVDPVAEMLALGEQAARDADIANITWAQGDTSQLGQLLPPGIDGATFAASFHWADRPVVVEMLAELLGDAGWIVVVDDDLPDAEQPDWVHAITEIRNNYLGDDHAAGLEPYLEPAVDHETVLRESPFSTVETRRWQWERTLSIDEVVGLQFTYSVSTPAVFGQQAASFADDVRFAVSQLHPNGRVVERFRVEVLIATRPDR